MLRIIWILFLPFVLKAQDFSSDFREKVGLVRVYCNQPKLDFLRKQAANPDLTADQRKQASEEASRHLVDRFAYTRSLIESFGENYFMTPVYFIPDSLYRAFLADKSGTYFLNKEGHLDSSIVLPTNQSYYLIVQENYDFDFRILQADGSPPPYPFPYKLKYGLFSKIRAMMGEHDSMSVKRLQKQLNEYFKYK